MHVVKVCNRIKTQRFGLKAGPRSNHPVPAFEFMPRASLPDGAVRLAAPTCRCAVCASRDYHQADYELKYVYPRGVFHANCYAELSLFELRFDGGGDCVEALLGSMEDAPPRSAEVQPLERETGSWSDEGELCDAHLAVWLG